MPPSSRGAADADELDHAVAFLKTRDGLDKSLKLMRYAAMLGAFGVDPRGVAGSKLRDLDRSTAVARKFLRLGKFLGNARDLRAHWRARARLIEKRAGAGAVATKVRRIEETDARASETHADALRVVSLNVGCSGASLAYYFLEQLVWARAVGLIRARRANARVARLAALAELAVYVFSLQMCWRELRDASAAFEDAEKALLQAKKRDDDDDDDEEEDDDDDDGDDGDDDDDGDGDGDDDDVSVRASLPFARRSLAAETERASTRASLTLRGGSGSAASSPLKNASRRAVRFLRRISRFEAFGSASRAANLEAALAAARRRLFLARAAMAAEAADAAACVGEVTGGKANPLRMPGLVGALGLVSAVCGVYEKWKATEP